MPHISKARSSNEQELQQEAAHTTPQNNAHLFALPVLLSIRLAPASVDGLLLLIPLLLLLLLQCPPLLLGLGLLLDLYQRVLCLLAGKGGGLSVTLALRRCGCRGRGRCADRSGPATGQACHQVCSKLPGGAPWRQALQQQ